MALKVHVAASRPVGERCRAWAKENLPLGWEYTDLMDECDVFISVMYAKLVSEEFIRGRRAYNLHPGLLPRYRGSGAFSWAILNGEEQSGVTLHELDVSIDHGDIIAKSTFDIGPHDTAEILFRRAERAMEDIFQVYFGALLRNDYEKLPQDESKAKLYYKRDLESQKDLTRFVRAFTFEGKENCFYFNERGDKIEMVWRQP